MRAYGVVAHVGAYPAPGKHCGSRLASWRAHC